MSVVEMGGDGAQSQETRATEASVRGFWKAYRALHGGVTCWASASRSSTRSTRGPSTTIASSSGPRFFTDPCLYKITSADNYRRGLAAGLIYADSRGMLQDRVAALREANIYERQAYRHLVGLPAIRAGSTARCTPRPRSWWCA